MHRYARIVPGDVGEFKPDLGDRGRMRGGGSRPGRRAVPTVPRRTVLPRQLSLPAGHTAPGPSRGGGLTSRPRPWRGAHHRSAASETLDHF
jgi:hypothetical protein